MDDGFIYLVLQQTIGLITVLFKENKSKTLEDKFGISGYEYKELEGEYDRQMKEYDKFGLSMPYDLGGLVEKYKLYKANREVCKIEE
ncbi:MAG: hypothetical protein A2904_01505 [Candidatus Staskawiczbacteria bacterium RIFCSPLOWO2_01_FULL_33_9]|uniref:Uncharacterized protein n=1 Tax=Candidatus Staskawiczbacteria bacterium RIFCSPLOWO2_01_FULL_33_9 TaxID=1802211 RepID=A0A1G2I878_9BACT|nr:MAG: hypothetical protein A2904_01505 [Candidatus Staskawiczbacteria bacterium RIFCSPLOWO2_01_FULL_33_9]